jgi:hypothetical protein
VILQDGNSPRKLIGKEVAPRTGLAGKVLGGGALPKFLGGNAKEKKKYQQLFDDAVQKGKDQRLARGGDRGVLLNYAVVHYSIIDCSSDS